MPGKPLHRRGRDSVAEEFRDEEVPQAVKRVPATARAGLGTLEGLVEAILGSGLALDGNSHRCPGTLLRWARFVE